MKYQGIISFKPQRGKNSIVYEMLIWATIYSYIGLLILPTLQV